jgi:hypothetical protein
MNKEAVKLLSHPIVRVLGGGAGGAFIANKLFPGGLPQASPSKIRRMFGVKKRQSPYIRAAQGALVTGGAMMGLNFRRRKLTKGLLPAMAVGATLGAFSGRR